MLSSPVFHRCGPGLEESSESQRSGTCGPGGPLPVTKLYCSLPAPHVFPRIFFYGDSVAESRGNVPFCFPFATNIQPL